MAGIDLQREQGERDFEKIYDDRALSSGKRPGSCEKFFANTPFKLPVLAQVERVEEVLDSILIDQEWRDDVRVVLFEQLREGLALDDDPAVRDLFSDLPELKS